MKKIFALGWMLVAALALTNCSKEEAFTEEPISGAVYEIVSNPETRTTNDGMNTKWAAEDAVNVFYAETGSEVYVDNNSFTISEENLSAGKFLGTLTKALDINKSYDWFMFYPYSSYIKSPANYDTGYSYIGGRSDRKQSQKGINNMDHIAGTNYPMTGKVSGVAGSETPAITMKHISALIAVNVTNSTDTAINVSEVAVTVDGESLVGTFYYNQVTGEYTDGNYVSNTATLAVTDGTIAAGANGIFYLATKPFYLDENDFTVNIVTEEGATVSKTIAPIGVAFNAGKIKTVNITVNEDNIEYPVLTTEKWTLLADPSEMVDGQYIIVANYNSGQISYLPSTTTSSAPKFSATDLFDLQSRTIEIEATGAMVWNFEHIAENRWYITNADGKYFYSTNANNGLRVGDTSEAWAIDTHADNSTAFVFKGATNSRFVGIYNAADWRCYNTYNASNYKGSSQLYLYYKGTVAEKAALATPEVTATVQNLNEIVVSWNAIDNAESYVVTCTNQEPVTVTEGTTYTFTGLSYDTTYTISVTANPADIAKYTASTGTTEATTGIPATVAYYEPVTTASELTAGKYLLVYKAGSIVADGSKAASKSGIGASGAKVAVTISEDGILSETNTDVAAFTITPVTGGYTIQNSASEYLNGPSADNGMIAGDEASGNHICAISINADGSAKIANFDATTQFVYNKNGYFRFYKNSTVTGNNASSYPALHIYKLAE